MLDGDHPDKDTSPVLDDNDYREYHMLMGMLNWIVILCRFDVGFSTSSLSRFTVCAREGHRKRVLRIFGYLKNILIIG